MIPDIKKLFYFETLHYQTSFGSKSFMITDRSLILLRRNLKLSFIYLVEFVSLVWFTRERNRS